MQNQNSRNQEMRKQSMERKNHITNREKAIRLLRLNTPFYLTGLVLILAMKYFYSRAGASQLLWLLAPTSGLVSLLSGIPFVYIQDIGYVNHGMKIMIAPSCSGMQFMLITAAMLLFSFVHLAASGKGPGLLGKSPIGKGFAWIGISIMLSYCFTVFINGLRIITALYLPLLFQRLQLFGDILTPDSLHTMIGTVVYFAALLTLYRLVRHLFYPAAEGSLLRRFLPPVFWYFFIVLGIPFLNRAYAQNGAQFIRFALLIMVCCGGIVLFYCACTLVRNFYDTFLQTQKPRSKSGDKHRT